MEKNFRPLITRNINLKKECVLFQINQVYLDLEELLGEQKHQQSLKLKIFFWSQHISYHLQLEKLQKN